MIKTFYISTFLIVFSLGFSELYSGFCSAIYKYNFSNYNSKTYGEIIRSEWGPGKYFRNSYRINYGYSVNGKYYIGDLVSFMTPSTNAEETLKKYPKGEKVVVFYDSKCPQDSILKVTPLGYKNWFHIILIFIGIPSFVFGLSKLYERYGLYDR